MPKELHILLSAYACAPNTTSEPGNGWNWATHLAERGMRVHVLTTNEGQEKIEAYLRSHPDARVSFSFVEVPKHFKHASWMHYARWQWAALAAGRALHRESPFDLAHHVTFSSIHVPTQLWRLGIPTIFGPVGGGQVTPKSLLGFLGRHRSAEVRRTVLTRALRYSPWHRSWLRKMTLVLATNTDTLRLVKNMGDARVEPWFDAALPKEFFAREPRTFPTGREPLRLLWVGGMWPRKALPLAFDVMARVKHPATLTIAGSGLPEAAVRQMITDRGLEDRIEWVGRRLIPLEMEQAYLQHDAMFFTSVRDSCPGQVVESMGSGLPVITLDHQGAADLIPDGGGIKVPVTTPAGVVRDLAAAIDRYAELSAEQRSEMSRVAWSFARNLNYVDGAELFERLYRQVLERSPSLTALPACARHLWSAAGSPARANAHS